MVTGGRHNGQYSSGKPEGTLGSICLESFRGQPGRCNFDYLLQFCICKNKSSFLVFHTKESPRSEFIKSDQSSSLGKVSWPHGFLWGGLLACRPTRKREVCKISLRAQEPNRTVVMMTFDVSLHPVLSPIL